MAKPSILKAIFEREERPKKNKSINKKEFLSREISGSVRHNVKKMQSMAFFRLTRAISDLTSHLSTRIYGMAMLCFGLVATLVYFIGISADQRAVTPVIGILIAGLAIPFLLVDKTLPVFLQDFRPTDYLFFEFFCMKRHSAMETVRTIPVVIAVLVGIIPAMTSLFIPLWQIALAILVIICVCIGITSPEFVFLTSLIVLPFIRYIPRCELVFIITVLLAVFSFFRKVVYGKRVFHLEQYDILIGIMLVFILISGIFVKGVESFYGSVKMLVFALGYILSSNIIANRRLAELSQSSIILSGAIASIISIVQVVYTLIDQGANTTQADLHFVLSRQDGVAIFLMATIVFAAGMKNQAPRSLRGLLSTSAILCLLALIISGEFWAITSLVLAACAYFIIKLNRAPAFLLPILLVISVAVLLLPDSILNVIFTYSPSVISASDLFDLWKKSLVLMSNHIAIGIGIGAESFVEEMAALGTYGHLDSSNLFIELGLEAGILAPLCFIFILVSRIKHRSTQHLYIRNSQVERASNLSGACILGFVAFGMVNYIWSDMSAYYLFWCIFGIGSASMRVAKRDYDDRVIYYEESSAFDSSVIDIEIG